MLDDETLVIEDFRDYLMLMARSLMGPKLKIKLDASDLVQQTMLDAHQKFPGFKGVTDSQLGAWLRKILKNNFLNAIRDFQRKKRDIRREVDWGKVAMDSFSRAEIWLAAKGLTPSEQISNQEQILRLPSALEKIPPNQKEAIILYHIQGYKLSEVAECMGKSESAVGGLLYRGLQNLKDQLT